MSILPRESVTPQAATPKHLRMEALYQVFGIMEVSAAYSSHSLYFSTRCVGVLGRASRKRTLSAAARTHTRVRPLAYPGIVAVATARAPSRRCGQDADQRAKDMACATTPSSSVVAPPAAFWRPGCPRVRTAA